MLDTSEVSSGPNYWSLYRKLRLTLVLALVLVTVLVGCEGQVTKPHVVLISIDCLNQRQFDSAVERNRAPSLASLKHDSIAFSRAYAHAPWTTPSHMSILTGLYPSQHGRDIPYRFMIEWNDFNDRVPSYQTLAERLSSAGYDTAAFVGQGSISGVYGLSQGFDLFQEHRKAKGMSDLLQSYHSLMKWISQRGDAPFFLFLHTYDLHDPWPRGLDTDADVIRYIDQFLGNFLLQLKTWGMYRQSLIILTGDHGSNMIKTDGKCCVHGAGHYDENLRIPLLLKLPDSSGRQEDILVRHIDILPTILEVLGISTSSDSSYDGPGVSILQRLEQTTNEVLFSYSEADARCAKRHALVTDRYKYIYTPKNHSQSLLQNSNLFFDDTCPKECRDLPTEELYDLESDPFERRNLLATNPSTDIAEWLDDLRLEMVGHMNLPRYWHTSVVPGPARQLDYLKLEQLRKSLRTLGYIE